MGEKKSIISVGCSFTWGQGLWVYEPNHPQPTYSEFVFENKQPTEEGKEYRKQLRWPKLVSNHFNTIDIGKEDNAGKDEESVFILQILRNKKYHPNQVCKIHDISNTKWVIVQTSGVLRNRAYFKYRNKDYIVELKGELFNHTKGDVPVYQVENRWSELYNEGTSCILPFQTDWYNYTIGEHSVDLFYDYLIETNQDIEEFLTNFRIHQFRKIEEELKVWESMGVKTAYWNWQTDYDELIKDSSDYDWMKQRQIRFNYKGNEWDNYESMTKNHSELYIIGDTTAKNYPRDEDEHPSKLGHEIISKSVIEHIEQNGGI
jgi:hypothetical protein